jgi:hypothetical protein
LGSSRRLPDRQSSGSVVAGLLPAEAHFVKAFGTPQHRDSVDPATGRSSVGTPLAEVKRRARIGQRLRIVRMGLRARSPATLLAP